MKSERRKRESSIPSFLQKLYQIINDSAQAGIIQWTAEGASFEVVDRETFTQRTLPTYFKHSNMNSFVRQLNMYDFHKCKRSTADCEFQHPFFRQGRPDLLPRIKRKTNSSYHAPQLDPEDDLSRVPPAPLPRGYPVDALNSAVVPPAQRGSP